MPSKAVSLLIYGGLLATGLLAGCQQKQAAVPAPAPVKREMRLKINGQSYTWPCRGGLTNDTQDFQEIIGGDPQGQAGIVVTFVRQRRSAGPEPYLARYGTITLQGVTHTITGISNNLGRTSWLQGELLTDEPANTFSGTFRGEDSEAPVVLEAGEFTTVIH